ncbi:MAG: hydantoinase/oxoprolinase family protein [Pseudomonadota bacterium]
MSDQLPIKIGVDIGGTFTDVAMEVGSKLYSTKVLTTYAAPEQAILDGILRVVADAGINHADVAMVIHGTTLATNALIERKGAKTAFLTTEGFRDVIEMRTENRFEQYDLNIVLPPPIIPRDRRFVVSERIGATGKVLLPLDGDGVARFAAEVSAQGFESVAVGFLHSFVNPEHEQGARDILHREAPQLSVSLSSEVSPQIREFERFNTVCSNAFVKPLMASYLNRLVVRLQEIGLNCPVFMIHSGGGLISVQTAAEFPVRLLESGPAGGAIFAADIAARHGLDKTLSYDMGGTTAKICLIDDYSPKTARTFEVARSYRFKKGSGMPISVPVIEMVEIGAGGGSIAHVDSMRQVRVGPESAGSEPGPACYLRGGVNPTVTDANLVLGKLDPATFAGGEIPLSADLAEQALVRVIGAPLGMDAAMSAISICEMVDENMVSAARVHGVENGKDLSGYAMIAYGGGAPLHAARLCEKLGIVELLIPPGAGVGSAIGFLRAPFGYEAVRGGYSSLQMFDVAWINRVLQSLEEEAVGIARAGAGGAAILVQRKAYMRYKGQGWEIPVDLPSGQFTADDTATLRALFEAEYAVLFGRPLDGLDIEILNWSVKATSAVPKPVAVGRLVAAQDAPIQQSRQIYDSKSARFLPAAIVQRSDMKPGVRVSGPAAIVENETTTIVTASFEAVMQADGCLLLKSKGV